MKPLSDVTRHDRTIEIHLGAAEVDAILFEYIAAKLNLPGASDGTSFRAGSGDLGDKEITIVVDYTKMPKAPSIPAAVPSIPVPVWTPSAA